MSLAKDQGKPPLATYCVPTPTFRYVTPPTPSDGFDEDESITTMRFSSGWRPFDGVFIAVMCLFNEYDDRPFGTVRCDLCGGDSMTFLMRLALVVFLMFERSLALL